MDPVEVEEVEPSDGDPVEEDRAGADEVRGVRKERDDLVGGVVPVDPDAADQHSLDRPGEGERDGDERGVALAARERAVVHADDPKMGFGERPPQGYRPRARPQTVVGSPLTLRCPECGQFLVAPSPPFHAAAWVACPNCGSPVPVLALRDPPPLFSWEVFPHLYPAVGSFQHPGRGLSRLVLALLVSATVLLAALGIGAALAGSAALASGTFTVQGVVQQGSSDPAVGPTPILGAVVNLTGENQQRLSTVTDLLGEFRFVGVQPGSVSLNISAPGYHSALVALFASATYSTVGADGRSVIVDMVPVSGRSNGTISTGPSPVFSDLESFVASDFSASILLGMGAAVAGAGAWASRRDRHHAMATAGGSAAIIAPITLFALGLTAAFPAAAWFGGLAIGVGTAAASLEATRMAARGQVPDPE